MLYTNSAITSPEKDNSFSWNCLYCSRYYFNCIIKKYGLKCKYIIVSEAGASIYSASDVAIEEFPDFSVEQRSAVSIARRIQDPLAELVKIDPKSIGVGQYQHDVAQNKLNKSLEDVVVDAVNKVVDSITLQYLVDKQKEKGNCGCC